MPDKMIEVKLDAYRKLQDNITKIGFTFKHDEIPEHLSSAALGKRYYLVFVDADWYDESGGATGNKLTPVESVESASPIPDKTEGKTVLALSHIRCEDKEFWCFVPALMGAADYIYKYCNIKSRSELVTNIDAQKKFRELDKKFDAWKDGQRYADNLERI